MSYINDKTFMAAEKDYLTPPYDALTECQLCYEEIGRGNESPDETLCYSCHVKENGLLTDELDKARAAAKVLKTSADALIEKVTALDMETILKADPEKVNYLMKFHQAMTDVEETVNKIGEALELIDGYKARMDQ